MRKKIIKATTLFLISISILGCRNRKISGDIIIKDINIVDVKSNQVLYNQTLVIRGNKIEEIIPYATNHEYQAENLIEGSGKYTIPGLWDMHVHSAHNASWHFPQFLAYGITGVRNMHATVDSALALVTTIKRQLASGELLGPRFIANGPIVDGEPAVWPGTVIVRTVDEARATVNKLADGGADFVKVYDHLTRDCYFAIMDQAKRRDIPVAGHVPYRVLPQEAAEAGQRTDEHMLGLQFGCSSRADSLRSAREKNEKLRQTYMEGIISEFKTERLLYDTRDPALCSATLEIYRKQGMAVVPNLVIHHNNNNPQEILSDTVAMQFIPGTMRDAWIRMAGPGPGEVIRTLMRPTREARYDNVRLIKEAGVRILAGTDLGNPMLIPGISLHQELNQLVEAGLTSAEALQTATLNPARFLGATDSLGTLEVGKLADLVVLDENPLEDIRNTRKIDGVIKNGIYLDKNQLNQLLKQVKDKFKTD